MYCIHRRNKYNLDCCATDNKISGNDDDDDVFCLPKEFISTIIAWSHLHHHYLYAFPLVFPLQISNLFRLLRVSKGEK